MNVLCFITALFSMASLVAQNSNELQYAAYLKASKTMWMKAIESAEAEYGEQSFERAMAMYGLLNNTMASKDENTFDEYVDPTIDLLKATIESRPDFGEPKAVLSSVYGLIMGYSPWKGILYGSKSSSYMAAAMKDQPDSPLVQKLYAGSKLYTPTMWGGSPEEAVKAYQKSISIYESENPTENWLYLDTLVGLALAYNKIEQSEKARETLNKVIELEPQHGWARSLLANLNR